jgi:RNase adaptor protein for sRNA GlmZ degradation
VSDKFSLLLTSSGKGAVLSGVVSADLLIDCRGMVNPFRDPELGGLHGSSDKLQAWMKEKNSDYIEGTLKLIDTAIQTFHTRGGGAGKEGPLKVHFFCLAGQHRSPALKHVVASYLKEDGYEVEVK